VNPAYAGTLEASQHQSVPSDTVSLGNTSPESSTTLPASSAVTCTTDLESSLDSGVDLSIQPASSTLPVPAPANENNSSLDLTSTMSLTFVCPHKKITCIDDDLPYTQTLPYSNDTLMDEVPSS